MHFLLKPSALLKSLGNISKNLLKKAEVDFSFFSNGFDMKCGQEFHGEKVRTWFSDVGEA